MGRPKGSKDKKPRKKRTDNNRLWESSPIWQSNRLDNSNPEYNSDLVRFIMAITPPSPVKIDDVEEMERRFTNYLVQCTNYGFKPSNMAAYLAIGITKEQARDWSCRVVGNKSRTSFIKKVQNICSVCRESMMADGKVNPVVGIFWQKNYDGMKDQQELTVSQADAIGSEDAQSLRDRYLGRVDEPKLIDIQ